MRGWGVLGESAGVYTEVCAASKGDVFDRFWSETGVFFILLWHWIFCFPGTVVTAYKLANW